jgi:gluconate 2-dehydrogenase gamma chain
MLTSTWLASNWPAVAAAAEHAEHAAKAPAPAGAGFLSAAEHADVAAIAEQILPSDALLPGAREAHAAHFIDQALATFFAYRAPAFRSGLADFQRAYRSGNPSSESFASASAASQLAFLESVDRTEFFESLRVLTILGTFSSSQYGGNFEGQGWKLMGFEDLHVFTAPFGYYDRDYPGFALANPAERS